MMVTVADLRELEAERLTAEIAERKASASKFRAEASFVRRQDEVLKQEKHEQDTSVYEQRILEFTGEVDEDSVSEAITILSEWRARSKDEITFRLSSPGGYCVDGFALYDYIRSLRDEGIVVNTVTLGWAASMGGILLQAGTKRYIAPNAHMLIHNVSSWVQGSIPYLEDAMIFTKSLEERCVMVLAERSTLSPSQIRDKMHRTDWWMSAAEVVELGFADSLWPPKKGRRKS